MFSLVAAERIDDATQDKEMQITNFCQSADCTYMNITSIEIPNKTIIYPNALMTKNGQNFNYTYTPMELGTYTFKTCGDPGGIPWCDSDTFESTPSGNSGGSNIAFFIFVILLIYGITFLGFFNEQAMMTIIGGMAMIFLGIYMISNGIIIFRDDLTNYIGYITTALGFGLTIFAIWKEWLQDW